MNDSTQSVDATDLSEWRSFAPVLDPGTAIAGRFTVLRLLGSGGSAVVYAVADGELRRNVALKLLRPRPHSDHSLKRLRREVAVARDVVSPRLVRIFDIGQSEYGPFLTMELCEGATLRERIAAGPLPVEEAIRITTELLEALGEIHGAGIIHRDIKPSNVLLDPGGGVKLADFGLAFRDVAGESRLTQTNGLLGTLEYLSPEQALGEEVDGRTDLYSLGVVLYEMLTGELPFQGNSSIGTVVAHLQAAPPSARERRPETPRWLARFTARLLEKRRERRYRSVAEALHVLRTRRVLWRPRMPLVAGVLLTLTCLLAFAGWQYKRTRFVRLVRDGDSVRAVDRRGATLWTANWPTTCQFKVMTVEGGPTIALIRDAGSNLVEGQKENHTLRFVDAQTGLEHRTIALPPSSIDGFKLLQPEILRCASPLRDFATSG